MLCALPCYAKYHSTVNNEGVNENVIFYTCSEKYLKIIFRKFNLLSYSERQSLSRDMPHILPSITKEYKAETQLFEN